MNATTARTSSGTPAGLIAAQFQTAAGFTPVPHEYWTVLPKKTQGGCGLQHFLVGYIMSRSVGKPRKKGTPPPEWTPVIKHAEFARVGGVTTRACELVLKDAAERGLIDREKREGGSYVYKARPDRWAAAKLPDDRARPAFDDEPEYDAAEPETRTPVRVCNGPLVLMPGKKSRPMPLREAVQRVSFESDGAAKISAVIEAGLLRVSIAVQGVAGIPSAEAFGEGGALTPSPPSDVGERKAKRTRTPVRVPTKAPIENKDVTALRSFLMPIFVNQIGKVADNKLLDRIVAELAAGPVTIERYKAHVVRRLREGVPDLRSGMFVRFSVDLALAAKERSKMQADDRERERKREEQAVVELREYHESLVKEIEASLLANDTAAIADAERFSPDLLKEARGRLARRRLQ